MTGTANLLAGVEFVDSSGGPGLKFIKAGDLQTGEQIDAIYQGRVQNPKYKNKMDVKLTLADGTPAVMNQAGNLGYRIEESKAQPGDAIRIVYLGKNEMSKGPYAGTAAHNFKVLTAKQVEE